ncbi:MAG: TIGR02186 family protein [Rhodospirillaceae bacterium]|nr:TIGR02186 family protein [Rhodospirillaceae bacterium]
MTARRFLRRILRGRSGAAALALLLAAAGPTVAAGPAAEAAAPSAAAESTECQAGGEAIVADLSTHTITVDARFAGAELLVFGTIGCPGDVVVTVRGPRRRMIVREKTKVAGIWVNGRSVSFNDVPVLYAIASTAPPERILPAAVRQARSIGVDALYLPVDRTPSDLDRFRGAMIDFQQGRAFYTRKPLPVEFIGRRLFRASIWLPASVPTGQYIADVYLVRDNAVIGAHSMALSVYRGGLEAKLYDFATERPALYGAAAVLAAVALGWAIGMLFKRP